MSRAALLLNSNADRSRAVDLIQRAPKGSRIEIKGGRRSIPQNDHMWLLLTDVARQKDHCGRKYTPDQWKVIFMHACGREVEFIPALDGAAFIPWGQRSSDLSKDEMSALIEFILSWGAQNGVVFYSEEAA